MSKFLGRDAAVAPIRSLKEKAAQLLGAFPARPPGFCVDCPERPVFSAMKIIERDTGNFHLSADIACHLFSPLPTFNISKTRLGYSLGLASNPTPNSLFCNTTAALMG